MVFHGTGNLEGLSEFDPAMTGQGNDQLGSGFYFTTNSDEASGYATAVTGNAGPGARKLGGDESPGVVPVYLAIKNPIWVKGSNLTYSESPRDPGAIQTGATRWMALAGRRCSWP